MRLPKYLSSPSVQLSLGIGMLMYVSYGTAYKAFDNVALITMALFIGLFIPYYSKISNNLEEFVNLRTAKISLGRLARFTPQLLFNVCIFLVLTRSAVFPVGNINDFGGIFGASILTTCASQGMQYIALAFASREIGDRNRNVLIALCANIVITALATVGLPWAKNAFLVCGFGFGALFFLIGLLSDWRSVYFKSGGIGVFFGTFNPIHRTHLSLIRDAIETRGLEKIYLHCTTVPKLHVDALRQGEIRIAKYEHGMRVYEKTNKADVHLNYFPTGNKFYEYETRLEMMQEAVREAGLSGKVEVLSLPDAYASAGFYAVLNHVKALAKGRPVHGIHGSDLGGMWVRSIYDESGWLYPYPVIRRDKVSATAIRNGVTGLTTKTVEKMMSQMRNDGKHPLTVSP